jgi:hypothetical protein
VKSRSARSPGLLPAQEHRKRNGDLSQEDDMTITFVCGWCGSRDVSRDAWADPDVERQAWGSVSNDRICQRPSARGSEEVDVEPMDSDKGNYINEDRL